MDRTLFSDSFAIPRTTILFFSAQEESGSSNQSQHSIETALLLKKRSDVEVGRRQGFSGGLHPREGPGAQAQVAMGGVREESDRSGGFDEQVPIESPLRFLAHAGPRSGAVL